MSISRTHFSCFICGVFCLFFLVAPCPKVHSETSILFSFADEVQTAGDSAAFTLYVLNEGKQEVTYTFPKQLKLNLVTENAQTFDVWAFGQNIPYSKQIPPQTFAKHEYSFKVPDAQNGQFHASIAGLDETQRILTICRPEESSKDISVSQRLEPKEKYPTLENLFTLYQPYVANISAYEPIYFLVGTDPEKSKFQLSLKYRLFNPKGDIAQKYSWLQGIHLAYTQTSFWDMESDSAPFEDTSYKPEVFFLSRNSKSRPDWLQGLFLQAGIQHESNGRGGDFSRSTNYVYLKPYAIFYDPGSRLGFQLSPKLLLYFNNDDDTNLDLPEYRGYVELETKFGKADSFLLTSTVRPAAEGISFQADLSYPISNFVGNNFDLYLQLQYSNALAESLINYQERTEAYRIGFSIVR